MSTHQQLYIEPHDRFPHQHFHSRRPTVVDVIVSLRTSEVLFVQSVHGPWGMVQGGIEKFDTNMIESGFREGSQEVDLPRGLVLHDWISLVHEFHNTIPAEDRGVTYKAKHLFFLLMPVWDKWRVRLNSENKKSEWIVSPWHLEVALKGTRPNKAHAIRVAIQKVQECGFLPQWDDMQNLSQLAA